MLHVDHGPLLLYSIRDNTLHGTWNISNQAVRKYGVFFENVM